MKDLLLIALFAALGAGGAGLLGWAAVRLLRRRSLMLSLFCVAAVTVLAVTSGTFAVARAMFLSGHDLGVVITVLGMASVVSLVISALLGRQVVAGSRALTEAARTVGTDGGFAAPEHPLGPELAQLSAELAATSARLAESRARAQVLDASRRELIAWISHDLRTPLAGLRAMAEALEDGVAEDPGRYLRRMRAEVERLTGMVDDLFELSRIQAGALSLSLSRVSVYDLVDEALAGAHPLARERGVRLEGRQVAAEPVEVDTGEITRVLANLLVNAIRSTPEDGVVAVSARREEDGVVLSVVDGCGGIPEQDLPRVFETGWRGSTARTPRPADPGSPGERGGGGGAGLGLAIVRGIVEAHAGLARVRNVAGGCCFEIVLPAARS
ncbi:sensor histidine kinase [Kitasatospora sp. NPDC101183]|uniref:sensor histidine kinase n=1 Tax=Kitasatospora sp. NPDC101183 TaxID=3364100 RepID=UPI003828A900